MKITFVKEKETKGTIRFKEAVKDGDTAKIGTLYVRKDALEGMQYDGEGNLTLDLAVPAVAPAPKKRGRKPKAAAKAVVANATV